MLCILKNCVINTVQYIRNLLAVFGLIHVTSDKNSYNLVQKIVFWFSIVWLTISYHNFFIIFCLSTIINSLSPNFESSSWQFSSVVLPVCTFCELYRCTLFLNCNKIRNQICLLMYVDALVMSVSMQFSNFINKNFLLPEDDNRSIGVVERLIQTLKRRLGVRRIDKNNTHFKLALDVAEIIKTKR